MSIHHRVPLVGVHAGTKPSRNSILPSSITLVRKISSHHAMSRFAYPASSSREDVCFHGSAASHTEVTKLIQKENEEGRMVGMIRLGSTHTTGSNTSGFNVRFHPGTILISDPSPTTQPLFRTVNVVTRTGAGKADNVSEAPSSSGEEVSISSPPQRHSRPSSHLIQL